MNGGEMDSENPHVLLREHQFKVVAAAERRAPPFGMRHFEPAEKCDRVARPAGPLRHSAGRAQAFDHVRPYGLLQHDHVRFALVDNSSQRFLAASAAVTNVVAEEPHAIRRTAFRTASGKAVPSGRRARIAPSPAFLEY